MQTEIVKIGELTPESEKILHRAAEILSAGGLVVFPTETVYGLGADATSSLAAARIYEAKNRPSDNPLIIHIADPSDAVAYAYTNEVYERLSSLFMPGPLTVILHARESIPKTTRGGLPTVAVRCPSHPVARRLIALFGRPIAAPSANLSGSPSPTRAMHVIDDMDTRVHMIIDGGDSDFGLESTIVRIDEDGALTLLRPGAITPEDITSAGFTLRIADAVTNQLKEGEIAQSPGMKYRHYAPSSPVILIDGETDKVISYYKEHTTKNSAVLCYEEEFSRIRGELPFVTAYSFGKHEDAEFRAHALFSILREADKHSHDVIYAPLPEAHGIGLALYNRMIRAAAYQIIRL